MDHRRAFTLLELLVVIALIGLLTGLTLAAVQRVRSAAQRATCQNNLRETALACTHYENQMGAYPTGCSYQGGTCPSSQPDGAAPALHRGDGLWRQSEAAFVTQPDFRHPVHPTATIIPQYICPTDARARGTKNFLLSPSDGDARMASARTRAIRAGTRFSGRCPVRRFARSPGRSDGRPEYDHPGSANGRRAMTYDWAGGTAVSGSIARVLLI